jgi:hypothetical protein
MRGAVAVIAVLIALAVFSPFVCAATYEAWTDGLSDAELNEDIFVVLSLAAVIDGTVLTAGDRPTIVVAVVVLTDDSGGDLAEPSTRSARAPPIPVVLPC